MLILRGSIKVDLIFPDEQHELEPPWQPTRENLAAVDQHFWDWILWLSGKQAGGNGELVDAELKKLHQHLLAPLGAQVPPPSLDQALAVYREIRAQAERRFGLQVSRALETEVAPALNVLVPRDTEPR